MSKLKQMLTIMLISLLALTITSCDVVKLDAHGNPILPVDPSEQGTFKTMSPGDIANKVWPKMLIEAKNKAIDLSAAIKMDSNQTRNVFVKFKGKVTDLKDTGLKTVLSVNTSSSDINLDLGPVILSNSVRDASSVINFDEFENQVQFARFSKAVNKKAIHNFTMPDKSWVGASVHVIAAVAINSHQVMSAVPIVLEKR